MSTSCPDELRNCDLQWYQLSDGNALAVVDDAEQSNQAHRGCNLFWFTRTGEIVRRERIALKKPAHSFGLKDNITTSFVAPCPGMIAGGIAMDPDAMPGQRESSEYWVSLGEAFSMVWPTLLTTSIASAALAWLCYRRQRQYGLPWTGVWAVFVLFLGVPGYFGYLAHRVWPSRLPCPNCGRLAPRDRPACMHCGQDFPAPAAKGIELFA